MFAFNTNNKSSSIKSNFCVIMNGMTMMMMMMLIALSSSMFIDIVEARERDRNQKRDDTRGRNSIRGAYDASKSQSFFDNLFNELKAPSTTATTTTTTTTTGSNNINNNVLVPQCDPSNRNSYYVTQNPVDTINDCTQYIDYCDKSMTTLSSKWGPDGAYIQPHSFYDTVATLYERCAKTCSDRVGGITQFCAMPEVAAPYAPSFNSATQSDTTYCSYINSEYHSRRSNAQTMIDHENTILQVMNTKRATTTGITCTRSDDRATVYPQASPVVMNASLRCAARIQAKNIVERTLEQQGKFPNNLHTACPQNLSSSETSNCDDFGTRIRSSGYEYREQGFGTIAENTAAGYRKLDCYQNPLLLFFLFLLLNSCFWFSSSTLLPQ